MSIIEGELILLTKWLWAPDSISDFVGGSPLASLGCLNKMKYNLMLMCSLQFIFY